MTRHQEERQTPADNDATEGKAAGGRREGDAVRPVGGGSKKSPSKRQSQAGRTEPSHRRGDDARPTGHPTSHRHATETGHYWEDDDPA